MYLMSRKLFIGLARLIVLRSKVTKVRRQFFPEKPLLGKD
jgi:hypothetical protein